MATSRTGTTDWKRRRERAIRRARRNDVTTCRYCGVTLDYEVSKQPNSAEVDHVTPHAHTGTNDGELQVICRRCNQSKGARVAPKAATVLAAKPLKVSGRWA